MELVERSTYLADLARFYQRAAGGIGHSVFITGEAGIGKTSLVNEFIRVLPKAAQILSGACDSLFTPRPLGPLFDIAISLGESYLELLRTEKERAFIFAAFLKGITDSTVPVVIIFEDIHWADEATLDFVKFLARRISRLKCLLVLTCRDAEMNFRYSLNALAAELPSNDFSRLALKPLSEEAVDKMAIDSGFLSGKEIFALTAGNAFFVTEILSAGTTDIPARIKDAVLAVFISRNQTMREQWELLSVVPSRIGRALSDEIEKEFSGGLQRFLEAGILISRGETYVFRHELFRIIVEESMTVYKRKNLHTKILDMMLVTPASYSQSEFLHHAKFAGNGDLVFNIAPTLAVEASAIGAHIESAKLFATAIEFAGHGNETLPWLFERHAYECYLTNQIPAAIASQEQSLGMWRKRKDRLKEGDALRFLSRLWWYDGHRGNAVRFAHEAIEILENGFPTRERAMAYSNLSQLSMLSENLSDTLSWGDKAIELATRMDDHEILAHALNNKGSVLTRFSDSFDAGEKTLQKSLAISLERNLQEHAARAYTNLVYAYVLNKEFDKAKTTLADALAYCESNDLNSWTFYMLGEKVKMLFETCAWSEASALAESLIKNPSHPAIVRINAIAARARILARQGKFPEARALIGEGKKLAMTTEESQRIIPMLCAESELCWLSGESPPVSDLISAEKNLFSAKEYSWLYTSLAQWMQKSGIPADTSVHYCGPFCNEVDAKWRDAAGEWESLGCRYEQALALFEADEKSQRSAVQLLDELNAPATNALFKARLKISGVKNIPRGLRESTRQNPAQLTRRQIEVLVCLHEGLQNKEIAEKLFISPKTVDHHLSAIFSQLQVNTRARAVAEAIRLKIIK